MAQQPPPQKPQLSIFDTEEKPKPKKKQDIIDDGDGDEDDFLSFRKDPILSSPPQKVKKDDIFEDDLFS